MRVGLALDSTVDLRYPPREAAAFVLRQAKAARDASLDCLLAADHHGVSAQSFVQNVPLLGRILADWPTADIGALFVLPLWNPVLVAEQLATLAALGSGTIIFAAGLGSNPHEYAAMGVGMKARGAAMEQAIRRVHEVLSGGDVYTDPDTRPHPLGLRPPDPVVSWIGGTANAAIDRAARLGDGWIAPPGVGGVQAGQLLATFREARERHGLNRASAVLRRDVLLTTSPAAAAAARLQMRVPTYAGYDPASRLIGDVQQVTDQLAEFAALGFTDVLVRPLGRTHDEVFATVDGLGLLRQQLHDGSG